MANTEKMQVLEEQVQQLQCDKIELIRSTSTEIERLRQIIRTLTNPSANNDIKDFKLEYEPLTNQERDKISSTNHIIAQKQANGSVNNEIAITKWGTDRAQIDANRVLGSLGEQKAYEYNKTFTENNRNNNGINAKTETKTDEEKKTHRSEESIFRLNTKRMSYKGFEFGDFGFMTTDFDQLSRGHTQWVNQVMHHPVQNGIVITASDDWCVMFWRFKKQHDNDELKRSKLRAELQLESRDNADITPNKTNNYYIDPKLQHIPGEIELLPVLKINTGLEVKGIAMSSNGCILACTCYDEEEDEGNPELQLYFDAEQRWTFKHHQFNPYFGNIGSKQRAKVNIEMDILDDSPFGVNDDSRMTQEDNGGRLISRRIISLPFEPIPHCIVLSRDNKYVFVAMYSSLQILKELNEELEEEYGGRDNMDSAALSKWPDHPVSLCCVNVTTQNLIECEKIWQYLGDDEHVQCMAISPNGARIAIGTSLGQLIVTGVQNLTADDEDCNLEDVNPLLQKIWSSAMIMNDETTQNDANPTGTDNDNDDNDANDNDNDGSITAMDWSPDSNWVICGHASGVLKFWRRNEKENRNENHNIRRLSTQLNRTIKTWMNSAKVQRKTKMFDCKWYLEGLHIEAINSISIRGTMMVSGADDGNVVIYDLLQTFVAKNVDSSPITIGRIDKIHGGRMVNSVALAKNYSELNLLIPTNAHFMVSSGADNIVHCVSIMDVCRETIRQNYSNQTHKLQ